MQIVNSTQGVQVHAEMHELNRIRQQLTSSQLALWGDHSSRIAAAFGLGNNDVANMVFNDCGLVVWAVLNPELGLAVAAGLTAIWAQLANLNGLCDLVETRYQHGELAIDRKIALEHQLLEFAATAPFWARGGFAHSPAKSIKGIDKSPAPIIQPPTSCLPPRPTSPPIIKPGPIAKPISPPQPEPTPPPTSSGGSVGLGPSAGGAGHGARVNSNAVPQAKRHVHLSSPRHQPKPEIPRGESLENLEELKGAASYKGYNAQN